MKTFLAALAACLLVSSAAFAGNTKKETVLGAGEIAQENLVCMPGENCVLIVGWKNGNDSDMDGSFTVNGTTVEPESMTGTRDAFIMIKNESKLPKLMLVVIKNHTTKNINLTLGTATSK